MTGWLLWIKARRGWAKSPTPPGWRPCDAVSLDHTVPHKARDAWGETCAVRLGRKCSDDALPDGASGPLLDFREETLTEKMP